MPGGELEPIRTTVTRNRWMTGDSASREPQPVIPKLWLEILRIAVKG
jgi:hypothetical protein